MVYVTRQSGMRPYTIGPIDHFVSVFDFFFTINFYLKIFLDIIIITLLKSA